MGATVQPGPVLLVVVAVLALAGAGLSAAARLGTGAATLTAALRAVLQLGAVSLIIVAVLRSGWLTAAFIVAMFLVAMFTSARRITDTRTGALAGLPIAASVAPVLVLVLATGLVPARPIAIVPIAGILIGGAMTATSLAGRFGLDGLHSRYGEYEAALALGFTSRQARRDICRPAAAQALVPALDQTRTVGLVTLPGAFVGVLLGGASPLAAGATQLLVLVGLLAGETVSALVTVELVAAGRLYRSPGYAARSGGAGGRRPGGPPRRRTDRGRDRWWPGGRSDRCTGYPRRVGLNHGRSGRFPQPRDNTEARLLGVEGSAAGADAPHRGAGTRPDQHGR